LGCSPAAGGTARDGQTAAETGTGGSAAVIETTTGGTPSGLGVVLGGEEATGGTGTKDCGHQDFTLAQKPADVLVVLDRSKSMVQDMTPTKWSMIVPTLQAVIDRTRTTIAWGLKLYPEGDDPVCTPATYPDDIAVPIGPGYADAVIYGIASAVAGGNGTPTGAAIDEAVKYLNTVATPNPKYILLATDGEPSCAGTTEDTGLARPLAISAVTAAAAAGFHTFVVGIATTKESATLVLNELAEAGKQPRPVLNSLETKYYLANTANELLGAFNTITSVVATCSFDLAKDPPDRNLVNVYLGADEPIRRDVNDADGWNYASDGSLTFQLYGSACDRVKSRGAQSVNVVYVCPGETVY
jgi:hypothetical protein